MLTRGLCVRSAINENQPVVVMVMVDARAGCEDCDWKCFTRNAHGVAAKHAKYHKHKTWVDIATSYTYDGGNQ